MIAVGCDAATARPVMLGSVCRWSACPAGEFKLLVPGNVSFALAFCEAVLCELACAALAPCALGLVRLGFVRCVAEAVIGITNFGKADTADSVPGPAFEKNTENGV